MRSSTGGDEAIIENLHLACNDSTKDIEFSIKVFFNNTQKKSDV